MKRPISAPLWAAVLFSYFFLVAIPSAHAYVDPGTGSYVFQVVIGAVLGAAVAVRVLWTRRWAVIPANTPHCPVPSVPPGAAPARAPLPEVKPATPPWPASSP